MTSHDVATFPVSQSLPKGNAYNLLHSSVSKHCIYIIYADVHVQAAPTRMAWSVTHNNDDDDYNHEGRATWHSEGNNQTLTTPSSDAVDSSYHRHDGRRNGQYLYKVVHNNKSK